MTVTGHIGLVIDTGGERVIVGVGGSIRVSHDLIWYGCHRSEGPTAGTSFYELERHKGKEIIHPLLVSWIEYPNNSLISLN